MSKALPGHVPENSRFLFGAVNVWLEVKENIQISMISVISLSNSMLLFLFLSRETQYWELMSHSILLYFKQWHSRPLTARYWDNKQKISFSLVQHNIYLIPQEYFELFS
jgi:hypothetical protein